MNFDKWSAFKSITPYKVTKILCFSLIISKSSLFFLGGFSLIEKKTFYKPIRNSYITHMQLPFTDEHHRLSLLPHVAFCTYTTTFH